MTKITLLAMALAAGSFGAQAADYDAGKKKATEVCGMCHGPEGNKPITPDTPILAGQHYEYLVAAINQYKKGERQNPMMAPMVQPLTKAEIKNLALYFSKQSGLRAKY
ncbi:MAG: cytochrome c [Betaproteobacteria bacterium]|nr:cytochrome c [Betaproteobacteria bacterium]